MRWPIQLFLPLLCCVAHAQTLQITNDQNVPLSSLQRVNVGEHVRLRIRVQPPGTVSSNPHWVITGTHIKDWVAKDATPQPMLVTDYLGETIHFLWRETTSVTSPYVVRASALVGGTILNAQLSVDVVRHEKPEKFYSDDLLMENHNNWHSVYMFFSAIQRRGDLFLAWHRSQLEYFNLWRDYFGYPRVRNWNPTSPWVVLGAPLPHQQHPTTIAPKALYSTRHDLTTLDLTNQGRQTASEGEFDLVTQSLGRGRRASFVSAGYVLRTETVRDIMCTACPPGIFSRNGPATIPTWWQAPLGTNADPWFAAGCPPNATSIATTCVPQTKRRLRDYSLREFGESIESGRYTNDFRVNYHALAHVAASEDMANPVTSMRDPIFWSWHLHIDTLLSQWQSATGVGGATLPLVVYGRPTFSATWDAVSVAFGSEIVPALLLPGNVTVNGTPATSVTNVSLTPGANFIFRFTGFPAPPAGPVEVIVRREINNTIRTSLTVPRPTPTLVMTPYGQILTPHTNRYAYVKP